MGAQGAQGAMPNAVVTVIEVMPHPADGSAAVGGSGTAGATGSSAAPDKMYRITLRMDDGTTRVVTQDKAPTFRNGDRVNMTDGMITQ
jgi:outer membrane lipoprotein SlyB